MAFDARADLFIADGDMHAIRLLPAAPGRLLGEQVVTGDLYLVAGARSVGPLYNHSVWIRVHLVEPAGLVVSEAGGLVYADSGADLVRRLQLGD